jgi:hypothetical protein
MSKSKIPNPNIQTSSNQPISKLSLDVWKFEFWNLFGVWDLVLGISV